jgi:hypothetical protein
MEKAFALQHRSAAAVAQQQQQHHHHQQQHGSAYAAAQPAQHTGLGPHSSQSAALRTAKGKKDGARRLL